jgi:hypothetical protein
LGMAVVGRTSSQQKHLMQRCSERLRKTPEVLSFHFMRWPCLTWSLTNFDRNPVFVFQIFQASKDIKSFSAGLFRKHFFCDGLHSKEPPHSNSKQIQHFQRQVCHQSLSSTSLRQFATSVQEPYSQAVAGSARHNLQCCLPSVSNHLGKKNTQDSMYFYYVHSKPIYNFCLWPPMAYAYWVSAPENWSPPCHKAADALRLLWPITGKHLAHWAQYFWGSKKCSAIAMPSRDSRDPGALNFPFWWLQIAEWTESSCNSVGSLRDPKLHPFPKFTCRTYRRQVSDIADI